MKNAVADPSFPEHLKSRINQIIGFTKLKARYKTFEQLRELHSEHDVFLADDRIITRLPQTLGKVFYKGTSKRPIPIAVAPGRKDKAEKSKKSNDDRASTAAVIPTALAKEIEKALGCVPVSLRPGTLVAVRVGLAAFKPQQLADNITTVVQKLIEKHVVKGWRNVRGIHVKGQSSFAVPLWLADELWTGDEDIVAAAEATEQLDGSSEQKEMGQKRKRNQTTSKGPQAGSRKRTRLEEAGKSEAAEEATRTRKHKLAAQKAKVFGEGV